MKRRSKNNYILDAFFELLWGIEVALICVVFDYFVLLNRLEKLYVPCNDVTICPQSMFYNFLYIVSRLIWVFAIVYPVILFVIALVKGYRHKK
jgi:hypothetical protein